MVSVNLRRCHDYLSFHDRMVESLKAGTQPMWPGEMEKHILQRHWWRRATKYWISVAEKELGRPYTIEKQDRVHPRYIRTFNGARR